MRQIFNWPDDVSISETTTNISPAGLPTFLIDFNSKELLTTEHHKKYKVGKKGYICLQLHNKDELKLGIHTNATQLPNGSKPT